MSAALTTQQLLDAALDVRTRFPRARVEKNRLGNLAIMDGGVYRGYLDLQTGQVEMFDTDEAGGTTP